MEKYVIILQLISSQGSQTWHLENPSTQVYESKRECDKQGAKVSYLIDDMIIAWKIKNITVSYRCAPYYEYPKVENK